MYSFWMWWVGEINPSLDEVPIISLLVTVFINLALGHTFVCPIWYLDLGYTTEEVKSYNSEITELVCDKKVK